MKILLALMLCASLGAPKFTIQPADIVFKNNNIEFIPTGPIRSMPDTVIKGAFIITRNR